MLIFVMPKLTLSFARSGVALPWITKVFMFISSMLTWNYFLDLFVLAGLIWFFIFFRTTKSGKKFFAYILYHIPVAHELIKKINLVRFARTFGNLLGSGLSVIDSLTIASSAISDHNFNNAIEKAMEDIKNGISISDSLSKYPKLIPSLFISMVKVGERTGGLEEILITFADFYDEELDTTLTQLTAFLEPILLLFMGVMIGSIALSIILPIYQLVGHFV